jgi:tetratricopeptide (TPR) repeat protein
VAWYDRREMSLVGTAVGHIRLEALLGAGGMGEVYRGFDEKLQREVAVKTLRAEFRLSEDTKARFWREARILSKLAHPAICQVYDLIETPEADWLVIELVEGQTLDDWRRHRELDVLEVLELALKIVEALAVAHRERIVHRDLKPENIMITPSGGIKILDFGIARSVLDPEADREAVRAASADDPDATIAFRAGSSTLAAVPDTATADTQLTQAGWVLGTVRYMSPEQAGGLEVGEASDMFSLGILLQELLTGRSAYPPGLLSETLALVIAGKSRPVEGADPEVARFLEDLKHPIPERRPTASQALIRLRWLLDRPERERRQRLRWIAAVTAFSLLALVLVVVSVLAVRAERARVRAEDLAAQLATEVDRANREAATANRVAGFLEDLFGAANPAEARGEEVTARELVARGVEQIGDELEAEPQIRARLEQILGQISLNLGDAQAAEELFRRALETRQGISGETVATIESRAHLGAVLVDRGELEAAAAELEAARLAIEPLTSSEPELAGFIFNQLGILAWNRGDLEAAEDLLEQSLALREQAERPDDEIADSLNNLGILAWQGGRFDEARSRLERALELTRQAKGEDHPAIVAQLNNIGILAREQGRFEEAERLHREALVLGEKVLGDDHPTLALVLNSLGRLLARLDRNPEAAVALKRASTILEARLGADHAETALALVRLGDVERRLGQLDAARRHLEEGQRRLIAALGADHPRVVEAATGRARLALATGDTTAAGSLYRQALELARGSLGGDHPETAALERELAALPQR